MWMQGTWASSVQSAESPEVMLNMDYKI